jgi:regulator of nucleoside diphosphate kinase
MLDTLTIQKPDIVISEADHARLSRMAEGLLDRLPEVAGELLAEVERAKVVAPEALPRNVVAMGSTVEFAVKAGQTRRVTLVYPDQADIAKDRISVLTPIGAALIGLGEGQSITWTTRDGRTRELRVLRVL